MNEDDIKVIRLALNKIWDCISNVFEEVKKILINVFKSKEFKEYKRRKNKYNKRVKNREKLYLKRRAKYGKY